MRSALAGRDEPDPLRNVDLQAKGIRGAGGGYSRLIGFAGIAINLGTDDVARQMKSRR